MFLKKYVVHLVLCGSLLMNIFLAIQGQLYRESIVAWQLGFDIAAAKSKISSGMTLDEVLNRVHHDPYKIQTVNDTTVYSWSTSQYKGFFLHFFSLTSRENGHYWLDITFDNQGRVVDVVLSEA